MNIYYFPLEVPISSSEIKGTEMLDIFVESDTLKHAIEKVKSNYKLDYGVEKVEFKNIKGKFNETCRGYVINYPDRKDLICTDNIDQLLECMEDEAISYNLHTDKCMIIK